MKYHLDQLKASEPKFYPTETQKQTANIRAAANKWAKDHNAIIHTRVVYGGIRLTLDKMDRVPEVKVLDGRVSWPFNRMAIGETTTVPAGYEQRARSCIQVHSKLNAKKFITETQGDGSLVVTRIE